MGQDMGQDMGQGDMGQGAPAGLATSSDGGAGDGGGGGEAEGARTCSLCLAPRRYPTATSCGCARLRIPSSTARPARPPTRPAARTHARTHAEGARARTHDARTQAPSQPPTHPARHPPRRRHIFCWQCVHEWLDGKGECPLCRQEITATSLLCLHGYT